MGTARKLLHSKTMKSELEMEIEKEEIKYRCQDHEIDFKTPEALLNHLKNECAEMLKKKNVCTYLDEGGKCCGESFRIGSLLILHYARIHELNACDSCYSTFVTSKELAEHQHDERVNVRLSKYHNPYPKTSPLHTLIPNRTLQMPLLCLFIRHTPTPRPTRSKPS